MKVCWIKNKFPFSAEHIGFHVRCSLLLSNLKPVKTKSNNTPQHHKNPLSSSLLRVQGFHSDIIQFLSPGMWCCITAQVVLHGPKPFTIKSTHSFKSQGQLTQWCTIMSQKTWIIISLVVTVDKQGIDTVKLIRGFLQLFTANVPKIWQAQVESLPMKPILLPRTNRLLMAPISIYSWASSLQRKHKELLNLLHTHLKCLWLNIFSYIVLISDKFACFFIHGNLLNDRDTFRMFTGTNFFTPDILGTLSISFTVS